MRVRSFAQLHRATRSRPPFFLRRPRFYAAIPATAPAVPTFNPPAHSDRERHVPITMTDERRLFEARAANREGRRLQLTETRADLTAQIDGIDRQLAALDETRGEWVIFGGKTDCGLIDDVWVYSLEQDGWVKLIGATMGEACIRSENPQLCVAMCK